MTAVASTVSIAYQRRRGSAPGPRFTLLDGLAGVMYLAILIPIWAVGTGNLEAPGYGLLAGYTTSPMIVNMFVHFCFFAYKARSMWSSFAAPRVHECPNCHNNFIVGAQREKETGKGGERYSLLRGEDYLDTDADAEHYIGASARPSEEHLRPECDDKDEGKGKSMMVV
ncbi:hypothetical protein G6011_10613 [Alternaria panax]|uniref:Uncharacterized protein n=1 Tax=Alternaria panax TaxID=48097 RepID=A0AAD4IC75_9PLEO|nr:hypothetical protein G6011_10613 [Alternaria panax]